LTIAERWRYIPPRMKRIGTPRAAALILAAAVLGIGQSRRAEAQGSDAWFSRDKAAHFSISGALAIGGYELGAIFFDRPAARVATGAALALTAGVTKEVADRYRGGDPSFRDLTWDVAGTATGVLVAWLIDKYFLRERNEPDARKAGAAPVSWAHARR
jgi:putative lipoprotein